LDNIRIDLVEVAGGDVDWIGLAQDRDRWRALVNSVLNLRVPLNAGKLSSVQITGYLSSSAQLHGVRHYSVKNWCRFFTAFLTFYRQVHPGSRGEKSIKCNIIFCII
jgi:hypothetical protein